MDTACDNFRGHPAVLWLPGRRDRHWTKRLRNLPSGNPGPAGIEELEATHERTRRFLNQLQWDAN